MVVGQVTSLADIPHGIGSGFLSGRSNSPPAMQQTSFLWDLAWVGFASGLIRSFILPPSILPLAACRNILCRMMGQ